MSYITIIILILLCFSVTDFILPKNKPLHGHLYKLAFLITFFLFTIKYYYGADVVNYYKCFSKIESPLSVLTSEKNVFEIGFMLYMSIFKWLGLSYWLMTAVVSIIYFYAIYKLFELIPSYKILALLILVVLDYNLIFATHRQCLAVSFCIFMYFAYVNKKYFLMLVYSILVVTMHKSGIVFVLPTLILWSLNFNVRRCDYFICLLVLFIMLLLPLQTILNNLVTVLPLGNEIKVSLYHHIIFMNKKQGIILLYAITLMLLSLYTINDSQYKKLSVIVLLGTFVISMFYQMHAVLWRLRSFFLPFMIVYLFYALTNRNSIIVYSALGRYNKLVINLAVVLMMTYITYGIYKNDILMRSLKSGIYEKSTIFDLLKRSEEDIKADRLKRASKYWSVENKENIEQHKRDK